MLTNYRKRTNRDCCNDGNNDVAAIAAVNELKLEIKKKERTHIRFADKQHQR
jgi:hypothetical protein